MPADLAYGSLIEQLATTSTRSQGSRGLRGLSRGDYSMERDSRVLRAAREPVRPLHLVGLSCGGAASLPSQRSIGALLSLALLEPAWMGKTGWPRRQACGERSTGSGRSARRR